MLTSNEVSPLQDVDSSDDHKHIQPRKTITETTAGPSPNLLAVGAIPRIFSQTSYTSQASSISLSPNARWRPGYDLMFQWDFLPKQPLHYAQAKEIPILPPPEGYQPDPPDGWDWVATFGKKTIIEPPEVESSGKTPPGSPPKKVDIKNLETIDEAACKEALLNFATENGYKTNIAKSHVASAVKTCNVVKLTLESFCESRMAGYSFESYKGYELGNDSFNAPNPWSITMYPNNEFETHTKKIEVPNSALAKECYTCNERGFNRCWKCHGLGQLLCRLCDGARKIKEKDEKGEETEEEIDCTFCGGFDGADGREQCEHCDGDGRLECNVCHGYRQLKIFIELAVVYTNHIEEFMVEDSGMPKTEVEQLKHETLFEQVLPRAAAITDFKLGPVVQASRAMIMKHKTCFSEEKTLKQRHKLTGVPISSVTYKWKDLDTKYWVYGSKPDYNVFAPDYPTDKSCACAVM